MPGHYAHVEVLEEYGIFQVVVFDGEDRALLFSRPYACEFEANSMASDLRKWLLDEPWPRPESV